LVAVLRRILEEEPLEVRIAGRSAVAVIGDVLRQAESRGKAGEVAQYLVGAKLKLRFGCDVPVYPANKADRKSRSDREARLGDFELADGVIEVAVGLPDDKHLAQIEEALQDVSSEVWLLTRAGRANMWESALADHLERDADRVVVMSVEAFIGQNVTELGEFSAKLKAEQLAELFKLYNERWVDVVGTPSIRIVVK
jgi:hypothetical protein